MTHPRTYREKKLGPVLIFSLLCHFLIMLFSTQLHLFIPLAPKQAPVYYVDLLDLPAAQPAPGSPVLSPQPVAPAAPKAAPDEMKLPLKAPKDRGRTPVVKTPAAPVQPARPAHDQAASTREFEERLARLQKQAEARHEAAALEALQRKVAASAKSTTAPSGIGKETGSEYASYIRSRLEDAFRQEDTFKPDRSKVVAIRLVLSRQGRIASLKMEQSSGDRMFNDAVVRAITRAEKDFRSPPGGGPLELNFIFKPQEVSKK